MVNSFEVMWNEWRAGEVEPSKWRVGISLAEIKWRAATSNEPFGDDKVESPGRSHQDIAEKESGRTHDQSHRQQDQHLRARPLAQRVSADHPGSVLGDAALPHGTHRHQDGQRHGQRHGDANRMQKFALQFSRNGGRRGHPQACQCRQQAAGHHDHPASDAMQAREALPNGRIELKCSQHTEQSGTDDVRHDGQRRGHEACVVGGDFAATRQTRQAHRACEHGHQAQ
jgi:hypothetical protein